MEFGLKHYWKPTPQIMRRIGDSMLGVATFAAGYTLIQGMQKICVVVFIVGAIGKFLSNFFTDGKED